MKNLFTFCLFSFIALSSFSQAPQKFSYQTVVRNASNQLLVGQTVGIKISILQGSANGSAVYAETHAPQTNANGLATLEIGGGSLLSGNFANINWANGPFFVKTETDPNGGNNYTITNTSQLLSVPYALYASSANTANTANTATTAGNGVPAGGTNGQVLTNCNGVVTWTNSGYCPGTIASLNCAEFSNVGTLTANLPATWVSCNISYAGGGGGIHNGQTVTSTGVIGLTATLSAGNFANGAGTLTYTITGTPDTSGTTSFALNIGGQSCSLNIIVYNNPPSTCGAPNMHNPAKTYGSMTDQDGNAYKTIIIGTQEWMAENLNTSIYRNGDAIANITDNNQWSGLTTGAYCFYGNNSQYECPYGKLYNWYALIDQRNICPTGWHVPSDIDWQELETYFGMTSNELNLNGYRGVSENIGGKLKSNNSLLWLDPNSGANNESGFSGIPAGTRSYDGYFYAINSFGFFGSTTLNGVEYNWGRYLNNSNSGINRPNSLLNRNAVSVRCLKD